MSELAPITVRPDQCGGRPCIRGMASTSKTSSSCSRRVPPTRKSSRTSRISEPVISLPSWSAAGEADHPILRVARCASWSMRSSRLRSREAWPNAADDRVLWDYALAAGAVMIARHEEFALRRTRVDAGPTVVRPCSA